MSASTFRSLPYELKAMITHRAPSFTTLQALLLADPSLLPCVTHLPGPILLRLLQQSFPAPASRLVLDHLLIVQTNLTTSPEYDSAHLSANLSHPQPLTANLSHPRPLTAWPAALLANPWPTIQHIVRLQATVTDFAAAFTTSGKTLPSLPVFDDADSEPTRLHRALWLYQVCCDLRQAGKKPAPELLDALGRYLGHFRTMDLRDLEVVYWWLQRLVGRRRGWAGLATWDGQVSEPWRTAGRVVRLWKEGGVLGLEELREFGERMGLLRREGGG